MNINQVLSQSKAYDHRGAHMGRPTIYPTSAILYLQRVRLDSGGYDPGGAYWGLPARNLYCAMDEEGAQLFVRASCRDEAKQAIIKWMAEMNTEYPTKFFR